MQFLVFSLSSIVFCDEAKTVYDPKIIPNEQMINWGKEAMANSTEMEGLLLGGRLMVLYLRVLLMKQLER